MAYSATADQLWKTFPVTFKKESNNSAQFLFMFVISFTELLHAFYHLLKV